MALSTPWSGYRSFDAFAVVLLTDRVFIGVPAGVFAAGGLFDDVVARSGSFTNLILPELDHDVVLAHAEEAADANHVSRGRRPFG